MEKEFEKRSSTKAVQSFFLKIHPDDNVLVALKDLVPGTKVSSNGSSFELRENVAAKHKFFENDMHAGDDVIMYGVLVGQLQSDVLKGQAMTTANTTHAAGKYSYRSFQYNWQAPDIGSCPIAKCSSDHSSALHLIRVFIDFRERLRKFFLRLHKATPARKN